jgi:protein ImuA
MPAVQPALQSVLLRPDIWRGDRHAHVAEGVASGFAALDTELPGGGWPRGALTELLLAGQGGIGELALLLPALQTCSAHGPVALVAPPLQPHAPAWAQVCPLDRLLFVRARGPEIGWAVEQLLGSGALGALLAWLPAQIDARSLRRLQLAAQDHPAPAFVFRAVTASRSASPAPLRLQLAASLQGLRVDILKRRGPPCAQTLMLAVARPVAPALLIARQTAHHTAPTAPVLAGEAWA